MTGYEGRQSLELKGYGVDTVPMLVLEEGTSPLGSVVLNQYELIQHGDLNTTVIGNPNASEPKKKKKDPEVSFRVLTQTLFFHGVIPCV